MVEEVSRVTLSRYRPRVENPLMPRRVRADSHMSENASAVDRRSSSDAEVALFRSLFRGGTDVYPRRFESRTTGRSGYAQACANE